MDLSHSADEKRRNVELITLSLIHGSLFTLKLYPMPTTAHYLEEVF